MKTAHRILTLSAFALVAALGPAAAHNRDPEDGSRAQEKLDRDTQKIEQRAQERDIKTAEERAKIEANADKDPAKAAEDLAKLDADTAKEAQKESEDLAKAQEDYADDAAKEAEDLAEREDRDDGRNSGSSHEIADLGSSEGAEHDGEGYAVKQGELVALDLPGKSLEAASAAGFKVIRQERLETLGRDVIHLSVPAGMSAVDARTRLRELAPDATVDLVHYYGLGLTAGESSKPLRGGKISKGASAPLTVGLIDTSVTSHPALNGARLITWSPGTQGPAPTEHGTAVASLIATQGRGTIYSANIFRGPAGRPFTSADVIAQALEWMLLQKVPTINMSLAGPRNAILDRLVRDALTRGFVVVAAAGNGGPTAPPAYPAAVPGVIAVTAVDKNAHVYRYANHGPYITVAAPGVDVVAANSRGGYARFTGTSFATPRVAGWIARCRTAGSSAATCKQKLRKSARDLGATGFDPVYGFGLID